MLKSWAQSSTDPAEVSRSIQGLIMGAGVMIIWMVHTFAHVDIGGDQITTLAIQLGGAGAALWTIYGLLTKAFVRVATV